jgi:predicted PurR-regulated permease PerM
MGRRVLFSVCVAAAVLLVVLLIWYLARLVFLLFAAALLALFLRGLANWLAERTRLSPGKSLAAVLLGLTAMVVLGAVFMVPRVVSQLGEITDALPGAIDALKGWMQRSDWGRAVLSRISIAGQATGIAAYAKTFFTITLNVAVNTVVVIVIAIYLAANPGPYLRGVLRLMPPAERGIAREILSEMGEALSRLLLGRVALMVLNAIVSGIGLALIGIPMWFTLGVLSGLLNLVPNFGPVIAAVPALLLGFTQSPAQAAWVALLYLVYQGIDGYVFTPMLQQRLISLPPALTITAQVILGALVGLVGVLVAEPALAVVIILVRFIYIERILEK